jgi:hypothetical protein
MKGLCKWALAVVVLAACGRDGAITEPTAPNAVPSSGGILAIGVDSVTGATIETNKDDYSPGEVVHLVGRGWAPGETVTLHMTEEPDTHADVDTSVVADASGGFSMHFYDVQTHDLGVTFTLTATGQASHSVAVATFTDGNVSLASTSPVSGVMSFAISYGNPSCTAAVFAAATSIGFSNGGSHSYPECTEVRAPTNVVVSGVTYTFSSWSVLNLQAGGPSDLAYTTGTVGSSQWLKFVAPSQNTTGAITANYTAPSNTAPTLSGVPTTLQSIPELASYTFDANAIDADLPAQTLTFSIVGALPTGASFNSSTGVFEWTPTEAQGPSGPHSFTVRVSDGVANTDQAVTINVTEVNDAPVLAAIGNKTVNELTLLSFTATANDSDEPANSLTFSLVGAPSGAAISAAGGFTFTPTEAQGPGDFTFKVRVTDNGSPNLTDEEEITVHVDEVNVAPVLDAIGNKSVDEGSLLTFTANAADADVPANTLTYSLDAGAPGGASINPTTGVFSWTPTDGPSQSQSITIRVTDNGSPAMNDYETISVTVNNVAPTIVAVNGPVAPIAAGSSNAVTWSFTDPGSDTWTCTIDWDSNNNFTAATYVATKSCSASTASLAPGLYSVTVKVSDDDGGSDTETLQAYIVVYDPNGGFVTGGGWFNSLAGYYRLNGGTAEGKANFGFVSKYQPGKTVPTGNTEFQFQAGNLNFKSTSYEWLVVAGTKAMYKGEGTIAGLTGVYGFLLSAIDGSPDKFRIKIWNKSTSELVYDTLPDDAADDADPATALGGGSIVVHTKK